MDNVQSHHGEKPGSHGGPGCWLLLVGVVVVFVIWRVVSYDDGGRGSRDYPDPGSYADKMCDVHPADEPDAVYLANGKWYDPECLNGFPWDE
jgi:hypothetical protein